MPQQSHCLFRTRVLTREATVCYRGPHQSPIRIKAGAERNSRVPAPSPWPQCGPRKPLVPRHVHECSAQVMWFPRSANPVVAHALGGQRASGLSRCWLKRPPRRRIGRFVAKFHCLVFSATFVRRVEEGSRWSSNGVTLPRRSFCERCGGMWRTRSAIANWKR